MPIVSGAYVAPTWQNNGPPPINASELQAMSDTIEGTQNAQLPIITKQPENAQAPIGSTVSFSVVATGTGTLNYQWEVYIPGTGWSNSSASGNKTNTVTFTANANNIKYLFRCKVSNANGTVYSNAAQVNSVFNFAPAFDPTVPVDNGAYCTYGYTLYRCTGANGHPASDWDDADFTAVSVDGGIANFFPTLFAPAGFGLGDTLPVRLRTGQSLNTDTDTKCGFYYWLSTNPPTGAPYAQAAGILTPRFQVVFGAAGDDRGKLAFRTKSANWTAWYELTGTALS